MASPDLAAARDIAESLMRDQIVVTIDPKGLSNAAMDPETLKISQPPGEPDEIYNAATLGGDDRELDGKARIRPGRAQPRAERVAGTSYIEQPYVVSIPWDAPEIPVGAIVTCVGSSNDPDLPGKEFTVRSAPVHTYVVTRQLVVELRS